jgi:hypothetical protein
MFLSYYSRESVCAAVQVAPNPCIRPRKSSDLMSAHRQRGESDGGIGRVVYCDGRGNGHFWATASVIRAVRGPRTRRSAGFAWAASAVAPSATTATADLRQPAVAETQAKIGAVSHDSDGSNASAGCALSPTALHSLNCCSAVTVSDDSISLKRLPRFPGRGAANPGLRWRVVAQRTSLRIAVAKIAGPLLPRWV